MKDFSQNNIPTVKAWGLAFPDRPSYYAIINRKRITENFRDYLLDPYEMEFEIAGSVRLYGRIYDDPKRPDGSFIHTPDIESIILEGSDYIFKTKYGVKFKCPANDYCRDITKMLNDLGSEHGLNWYVRHHYLTMFDDPVTRESFL